jgi:hypothetical protein
LNKNDDPIFDTLNIKTGGDKGNSQTFINFLGAPTGNPRLAWGRKSVSASSYYQADCAPNGAFDKDIVYSGWANYGDWVVSPEHPEWIKYYNGAGITMKNYSMIRSCDQYGGWCNDAYSPSNWTLYGSYDNINWWLLDVQTDQLVATDGNPYFYDISSSPNISAYPYYIWNFTASYTGDYYVSLTEILINDLTGGIGQDGFILDDAFGEMYDLTAYRFWGEGSELTFGKTPYVNQAVCYVALNKLGHCTSAIGIDGSCTCVAN